MARVDSISQSAQVVSPDDVRIWRSFTNRQQERKPVWPESSRKPRAVPLPFSARRLWTEQIVLRPPLATNEPDGENCVKPTEDGRGARCSPCGMHA